MVIDFHTHCFPEKIAQKAMEKLGYAAGIMPVSDGTSGGLLSSMQDSGVDISVVLSVATNQKQQRAVNDFAASLCSDKIIAFGSIFPDSPDAIDELERIKALELKGVKLHPEYQQFDIVHLCGAVDGRYFIGKIYSHNRLQSMHCHSTFYCRIGIYLAWSFA